MATQNPTPTRAAKAPRFWKVANRTGHHGTRDQLVRVGIPDAWLADLPAPGKKRGCRTLYANGAEVYVSVGERGVFYVQTIQHLDTQGIEKRRGADFAAFMAGALGSGPQG